MSSIRVGHDLCGRCDCDGALHDTVSGFPMINGKFEATKVKLGSGICAFVFISIPLWPLNAALFFIGLRPFHDTV